MCRRCAIDVAGGVVLGEWADGWMTSRGGDGEGGGRGGRGGVGGG